jgi:aminopeptidase N
VIRGLRSAGAWLVALAPVPLAAQVGAVVPQTAVSYTITLVPSDTGTHLLAEVETGWRLRTVNPVEVNLDTAFRVVRVLVDGKPNTRLSRTMYARPVGQVIVPHEKAPGDTLTTRLRYHGLARGGVHLGPGRAGARALAGEAAGDEASPWLPLPADPARARVTVVWNVQADTGQRVAANGTFTGVDTLNYGHTTWHYRLDAPVPLDRLAVAAGRYAVTTIPHAACRGPCVPVNLWTVPGDSAAAAAAFRRAGDVLDFMVARLGPYPYPGLAHVAVPLAPAGRPGASIVLYDETRVRGVTEADIARATAAQWLGNAVSDSGAAGDRPAEAAAAYVALLWPGGTAPRGPAPDATVLARGVEAIRRLHRAVGDSAFFRGLRRYIQENRNLTVAPAALERAMAEAAGKPLDWSWRAAVGSR